MGNCWAVKEWTIDKCNNMNKSQKYYWWEKQDKMKYILYDSICMNF